MSSDDKLDVLEFIELVDRLSYLLQDENDLLDNGQVTEIEALQDEKLKLAAVVRQTAVAIATDPSILDDGSEYAEDDKAELAEAVEVLRRLSDINANRLRAAIRSTDRLIKTVVRATYEAQTGDTRYTSLGQSETPRAAENRALNQIS